jgi:4-hydroxymandelate oxidase
MPILLALTRSGCIIQGAAHAWRRRWAPCSASAASAANSIEEIAAAATGPKWYQLYVPKDRGVARRLVERAEQAGFQAIVVTVDLGEWKDADRRNRFTLPREMLFKHLRDVGFPEVRDTMSDAELIAFNSSAWDLTFSWELFDWLRGITKLPLVMKGILRPEDALRAVEAGLDGIVVSNHGGCSTPCLRRSRCCPTSSRSAVEPRC